MSQYIFKYIYIIFVCFLFVSCDDIPRVNILDPNNPDSKRSQIVAVEAFVNTNNSFDYNEWILEALDELENRHKDDITIAEYHRTVDIYSDDYHHPENDILHDLYSGDDPKGVPDVFINGIAARVTGASSITNALSRLESALNPFLVQTSFFTIEPEVKRNDNQISISTTVARLGSESSSDILIKVIVIEKIDDQHLKRVVREIFSSDIITRLDNGKTWETSEPWEYTITPGSDLSVIINITSGDEKNIFQTKEVIVP